MKINWTVRFKNKLFWLTLVPALIILIQSVAALFGFTIDLTEIGTKLVDVIEAVFVILAIVGIVTDHTTAGISDSENALTYDTPKK